MLLSPYTARESWLIGCRCKSFFNIWSRMSGSLTRCNGRGVLPFDWYGPHREGFAKSPCWFHETFLVEGFLYFWGKIARISYVYRRFLSTMVARSLHINLSTSDISRDSSRLRGSWVVLAPRNGCRRGWNIWSIWQISICQSMIPRTANTQTRRLNCLLWRHDYAMKPSRVK